ncbi:hypothetical protein ZWY2020_051327 [Hordeum vulgare]|nr:hypothetical protein ZWY2020_051327 [Hordeum vulgare]
MGTNEQGYHLLWPDLPIFLENQFTARPTRHQSCVAYACAPKRLLTLYNSVGRATATFLTTLAACWFSIIQSTTNRMKPLRISFDENPCSALARRY